MVAYAYQLVFDTKKFLKGRGVDKTATLITRFAGSFMIATVLMAIYIAFIRSGGVEATWAFFNLVFIMNVSILFVNFYTLKIDKTGLTKKLETMEYMLHSFLLLSVLFFVTVWLIKFTFKEIHGKVYEYC